MSALAAAGFGVPTPTYKPEPEVFGETRTFTGDGGPSLLVPGLKSLEQVKIGGVVMEMEVSQKVPLNPSLTDHYQHRAPLFLLVQEESGATLKRNIQSNDGLWQKGAIIHVTGEWETAAKPKPEAK